MKRLVPERLLYILAPGLLVLVACVQMTLVRTHDLTAWKGGGFGMFSTFDGPAARTLRVDLLTGEGEALVAFPELDVREARLLNMPDTGLLTRLAERTAQRRWVVYTYDELLEMEEVLPDEIRRQLIRSETKRREALAADSTAALPEPYPRLVAFTAESRPVGFEGRAVEVRGARAEVWRFWLEAPADRLRAEVVNGTTVPRTETDG